jgi:hypothetical protein
MLQRKERSLLIIGKFYSCYFLLIVVERVLTFQNFRIEVDRSILGKTARIKIFSSITSGNICTKRSVSKLWLSYSYRE